MSGVRGGLVPQCVEDGHDDGVQQRQWCQHTLDHEEASAGAVEGGGEEECVLYTVRATACETADERDSALSWMMRRVKERMDAAIRSWQII